MSAQTPAFANLNICTNCECILSFWRRNPRHHCRACGNTFCAKCSEKTSIIPQYGIEEEVRVCDSCYAQIQISLNPPVHESPVRESMFELDEEEAVNLALALSNSEAEKKTTGKPSHIKLVVNRSDSRNKTECPICLEERLEWALKNCGHVVCDECLTNIEKCPICRKKVEGAIRIYINS